MLMKVNETNTLTIAQRTKLREKWKQQHTEGLSFYGFLNKVNPEIQGAVTVEWCGMILCIETDGYCHT